MVINLVVVCSRNDAATHSNYSGLIATRLSASHGTVTRDQATKGQGEQLEDYQSVSERSAVGREIMQAVAWQSTPVFIVELF